MSDSLWPHRRQLTRLHRPPHSPDKNTGVGCHFLLQCMKVKSECEVPQSCPTLHDPMDFSLQSSSIHGIFPCKSTGVDFHCLFCPRWLSGKEICRRCKRYGFDPWVRKIPWTSKWQNTSVSLLGKSHGQRNLVNYKSMRSQGIRHNWAHTQSPYIVLFRFFSLIVYYKILSIIPCTVE